MDTSNPLGPIFAAGFAVQQFLEVLSPLVEKYLGESRKKMVLGVIGFFVGLLLASHFDLHALKYFNVAGSGGPLDTIVTAFILSAGTEGTNSIVKFLKYLKEDKKTDAVEKVQSIMERSASGPASAPSVSPAAMRTLDKMREAAGIDAGSKFAPASPTAMRGEPAKVRAFSFISDK